MSEQVISEQVMSEQVMSEHVPSRHVTVYEVGPRDGLQNEPGFVPTATKVCLLYTSPSPRDISGSRMPSSA